MGQQCPQGAGLLFEFSANDLVEIEVSNASFRATSNFIMNEGFKQVPSNEYRCALMSKGFPAISQ